MILYRGYAILSGVFLTLMIYLNSLIAQDTTAVYASFLPHLIGLGFLVSCVAFQRLRSGTHGTALDSVDFKGIPRWVFFGGLYEAFLVVFESKAIATGIPLSHYLCYSLMLVTSMGLLIDSKGWLGLVSRKIRTRDWIELGLLVSGALLVIFGREQG